MLPDTVLWSNQEDVAIACLVLRVGKRWTVVAERLSALRLGPRRSSNSVRNRWKRVQRGREGKNHCQKCGCLRLGHSCPVLDEFDLFLKGP